MAIENSSRYRIVEGRTTVDWRDPPTSVAEGDSGYDTGHLSELEDFLACVRAGKRESASSISDGWKSMALYEALRRSALKGTVETPSCWRAMQGA